MTTGAPGVGTGSVTIASNSKTTSLCREIKTVQDLIERCLQLYMSKDEVVKTLLRYARIPPDFTSIVWNRLEQENTEFFKAYYIKLVLKKQIAKFNELLEDHHKLLCYAAPLEAPLAPMQEGIKHMPVNHLHKVYTLPQQHPIPSSSNSQNDSTGIISNYDPLYANPECGNFLSTQMNYGRWMAMNNKAADLEPIQPFMKLEIPGPVSVTSQGHFPFIAREIQESVGPSAVEFAGLSHVQSVRHVPFGPGNASFKNFADVEGYSGSSSTGLLDPSARNDNGYSGSNSTVLLDPSARNDNGYSGSSSTGLLDPSVQNDNVEEFLADAFPAAASQSEEES
ncbi:helicase with zinc finger protein [Salix suchowensis]|nr:helicase with zinc finger protein [Salix suchowensis]